MVRIVESRHSKTPPLLDLEKTDPGILSPIVSLEPDAYIGPQEGEKQTSSVFPLLPEWLRNLVDKKRALKEAKELIAKIEHLPNAHPASIQRYFDIDLPRLVGISQKYPQKIQRELASALSESPNQKTKTWYRLVQIAIGDKEAFLSTLDQLC